MIIETREQLTELKKPRYLYVESAGCSVGINLSEEALHELYDEIELHNTSCPGRDGMMRLKYEDEFLHIVPVQEEELGFGELIRRFANRSESVAEVTAELHRRVENDTENLASLALFSTAPLSDFLEFLAVRCEEVETAINLSDLHELYDDYCKVVSEAALEASYATR